MKLWYSKPASDWREALPIGNGRLGAMIYGGADREKLQINEESLWSGGPHDYNNTGAAGHLQTIRDLIFNDKMEQAQEVFDDEMRGNPACLQAYLPFCDLLLDFPNHHEASDYYRELDLERAISKVRYQVDGVTFTREVFCSYPDQVIIMRISASEQKMINVDVSLDTVFPEHHVHIYGDNTLILNGQVGEREEALNKLISAWDGPGLRFEARVLAIPEGGSVSNAGERLAVRDADAVLFIFSGATSYVDYKNISGNPGEKAGSYIADLAGRSYEDIINRHYEDYSSLYRRVQIDLDDKHGDDMPTDRRILTYQDTEDPGMAALYYQYGRYLLISSSRPGGQAANLQGIWNEEEYPLWGSKWTTNINVQMNYWAAESGNLSECHLPLFDLIDDLRITGARTAEEHYGCQGFVVHHNVDIWRAATPVDSYAGVWPMGGIWLAQHLWDHYEYDPDMEFLRNKVYPVFREAALFMLDFLIEAPEGSKLAGMLVTNPSYSPENNYIDQVNRKRYLTYAATMDIQLIGDLFNRCIKASELMDVDDEFRELMKETLRRIPQMQIGKYGQLQEWIEDWDRPEDHNGHVSHLYGLYPGDQISLKDTPKLAEGVRKSLELRGTQDFRAWPAAWRIALHAHLRDEVMAHHRLVNLISGSANPNLLNLRPPLPMQIDGNFGGTAGITEMLLQSKACYDGLDVVYEIDLLPALPEQWSLGSIKGLRARGGFQIDFSWENGKLVKALLHSRNGEKCEVHYNNEIIQLDTMAGVSYPLILNKEA